MSTVTELEGDTVLQSVAPCTESSGSIERTPASESLTTPTGPAFATTRTAEPPLDANAENIPSREGSVSLAAIEPVVESSLTPATLSVSAPYEPIEPLPHESALVGPLAPAPLAEFSPLPRGPLRPPPPPYPWEWALLGFCGTLLLVVAVLHRQGGLDRFHGILSRSRYGFVDASAAVGSSSAKPAASSEASAAAAPNRHEAASHAAPNATAAWAGLASGDALEASRSPRDATLELVATPGDAHEGSTPDAAERGASSATPRAANGEPSLGSASSAAATTARAERSTTRTKASKRASKRRKARRAAKDREDSAVVHARARPERLGEPSRAMAKPVSSPRVPKRRSVAAGLALELPP